jgi:hypothetical protein
MGMLPQPIPSLNNDHQDASMPAEHAIIPNPH